MKTLKLLFVITLLISASNIYAQKAEDFKTFWKSYTSDSIFQKERIKFPLKYTYYEEDDLTEYDYKKVTRYIKAENYHYDKIYDTETYIVEIKQENNTCYVIRGGVDSGINLKYVFILYNDKWYLTQIYDYSD